MTAGRLPTRPTGPPSAPPRQKDGNSPAPVNSGPEKVSGTVLDGPRLPLINSPHGTTAARRRRRPDRPRPEPRQRPPEPLRRRRRLRRLAPRAGRGRAALPCATVGLLRHAQPFPPRARHRRRWRTLSVDALADPDPHPALARPPSLGRLGARLPGAVQVLPCASDKPRPPAARLASSSGVGIPRPPCGLPRRGRRNALRRSSERPGCGSAHGPAAATSAIAAQLVAAAEIHWSCPWGKPLSK